MGGVVVREGGGSSVAGELSERVVGVAWDRVGGVGVGGEVSVCRGEGGYPAVGCAMERASDRWRG